MTLLEEWTAAKAEAARLEALLPATPARNLEWLVGLLALLLVGIVLWDHFKPTAQPVGQWSAAEESKLVSGILKEHLKMTKTLTVYAPTAKKKLDLPPEIQSDPNKYVLSASTVKPSLRSTTITEVVDKETGASTELVRVEPYPLIAAEQTGEARIDYGIKSTGATVGRLSLREGLVQVKGVNLGVTATVDTDRAAFAGVGLGYRW
jgi:hypothetical protein